MSQPEAWLLGRVEGVSDAMMPVAHSLVQDAIAHNTEINELIMVALDRIDHCLEHLTAIPDEQLYEPRRVGRDELPSTVIGLLFHAAEHTTMHVGQIRTTLKVIRGTP